MKSMTIHRVIIVCAAETIPSRETLFLSVRSEDITRRTMLKALFSAYCNCLDRHHILARAAISSLSVPNSF